VVDQRDDRIRAEFALSTNLTEAEGWRGYNVASKIATFYQHVKAGAV
jgi:hypothetical protein